MKNPAQNSLLAVFDDEKLFDKVRAAAPDLILIELGIVGTAENLCRRLRVGSRSAHARKRSFVTSAQR
jgi:hypothetical protein